jgi:hypothetical protein
LFHDSENEGEMGSPNEVNIPCCTLEDKGAIHEDETITHAENTKVLEAPAQEETVSYPPPQDFDNSLLYDGGGGGGNKCECFQILHVMTLIVT